MQNQNRNEEIKNNTQLKITFKFNGTLYRNMTHTYHEWIMFSINALNRFNLDPIDIIINCLVYDTKRQRMPTKLYPIFYNKEVKKHKRKHKRIREYKDGDDAPYELDDVMLPNFIYCLMNYNRLFKKPMRQYIEQNLKGTRPDYPYEDGASVAHFMRCQVHNILRINNVYYGPQSIMDIYNNFMENIHP